MAANPFNLVQLGYWGEIFSRGADFAMRTDISMMIQRNRDVLASAVDVDGLLRARSYRELCRQFHCVVHAQDDLDTMLSASSCAPLLGHVRTPMLCVSAADDPVVNPMVIPFATFGKSDSLVLALTNSGGAHARTPPPPVRPLADNRPTCRPSRVHGLEPAHPKLARRCHPQLVHQLHGGARLAQPHVKAVADSRAKGIVRRIIYMWADCGLHLFLASFSSEQLARLSRYRRRR